MGETISGEIEEQIDKLPFALRKQPLDNGVLNIRWTLSAHATQSITRIFMEHHV